MKITSTQYWKNATFTALALLLAACGGEQRPAPWNTSQGNAARTGYVPIQLNPNSFQLRWEITHASDGHAVAGDKRYIATQNGNAITVIDSFTGKTKWAESFSSDIRLSSSALYDGTLFLQSSDASISHLLAYDIATHQRRFDTPTGSTGRAQTAPLVLNKIAYSSVAEHALFAVRSDSGEAVWSVDDTGVSSALAANSSHVISYEGNQAPQLTVRDTQTGSVLFNIPDTGAQGTVLTEEAVPILGTQNNALISTNERLACFDLKNKTLKWQINGTNTPPAIAKGVVYLIKDSQLEAHKESDGSLLWRWGTDVKHSLVVTNNLLFVSAGESTFAIDIATRKPIWSYPLAGNISLNNGALLISTNQKLSAIDIELDSDSDQLPTYWENYYGGDLAPDDDLDGDGINNITEYLSHTEPTKTDSDDDGLTDDLEIYTYKTDPASTDTDNDGISDIEEIKTIFSNPSNDDSDGDQLIDSDELAFGMNPNDPTDGLTDADGDGFSNALEIGVNTRINDASSKPDTTWRTQYGNNDRTNYIPLTFNVNEFKQTWKKVFERILNPAVEVNGKVFVTTHTYWDEQKLFALDATSGEELWQFSFDGPYWDNWYDISATSYYDKKIYVHTGGTHGGRIWAFDEASGQSLFTTNLRSVLFPHLIAPTVENGKIYISNTAGLTMLDANNGALRWHNNKNKLMEEQPPLIRGNNIYAVSDSKLLTFDRKTGKNKAEFDLQLPSIRSVKLTQYHDLIAANSNLNSANIERQQLNWIQDQSPQYGQETAIGGRTIFSRSEDKIIAINESNGRTRWEWIAPERLRSGIIATANLIFVSGFYNTYAIDQQTHETVWSINTGGELSFGEEGYLFIASNGGYPTYLTAIKLK